MKRMAWDGRIFVLLSMIFFFPPVSSRGEKTEPGSGERPAKIIIGYQDHFVPVVAEALGWWKEEGLEVELRTFPGGPEDEVKAFLKGELDVAYDGTTSALYAISEQTEKGHKIVAFDHTDLATLAIQATDGKPDFKWKGPRSILEFKQEYGRPMRISH